MSENVATYLNHPKLTNGKENFYFWVFCKLYMPHAVVQVSYFSMLGVGLELKI